MAENDGRLYAYGKEEKPIIDAKFSQGSGPGEKPVGVQMEEVDGRKDTLVVTLFDKYQAGRHSFERTMGRAHPIGRPLPWRCDMKNRREFLRDAVAAAGAALPNPAGIVRAGQAQTPEPIPSPPRRPLKGTKLKASPNGRYFVNQDGKPFFYLGDTVWLIFQRFDKDE